MAGWDTKEGLYKLQILSEDEIWTMFNSILSNKTVNKSSYKFGFLKSILDNLFNVNESLGYYISYYDLFSKFAENYWNLIVKYGLKQIRQDSRNITSGIEKVFMEATNNNPILSTITFDSIGKLDQEQIKKKVEVQCKKYVIGALYVDSGNLLYDFTLNGTGITLNPVIYEFLLKYKTEIEKINYYEWAKFLESINEDNVLIKVLDKLDISTKRKDLSLYRMILRKEFEQNNCFYCGNQLGKVVHVDHFIPWSFVKDDKIWNFVLSCSRCNERKSNKIVVKDYLIKLEDRNRKLASIEDNTGIITYECEHYSDEILRRMWNYARYSGLEEMKAVF